jgi:non-heme chloroperoxidase
MLIAHGEDDQIVPIAAAALKSAELVDGATLGIAGPYQEAFDKELLAFIAG